MSDTSEPTQKYQVVAPYVTCRVPNTGFARGTWLVVGFNQNAIIPADAHPDDIAHLLSGGVLDPNPKPMIVAWPAQAE
jgi:hypothetical protein